MKQSRSARMLRLYPIIGVLLYILLGVFWILFSDQLLLGLTDDSAQLIRYQTYKGILYVALTGLLAWLLLRQHQRLTASLQASEQAFSQTFDHAAAGIAHAAPDGRFLRVNQHFADMLGYSPAEMRNMSFQQITHPEDLDQDQRQFDQLASGMISSYTLEKRYFHKAGYSIWVKLAVAKVPRKQHDTCYFIGVVQDISAQKRAEQQLLESELRFRTLLDNAPQISVQGYDQNGTTIYWNRASELIYGYSKEEALGRSLLQLIIPDELHQEVRQAMTYMAEHAEPIAAEELTLKRKDGSLISVFSNHAVVKLPDKPPQIFCIDIDLTERKRQAAQLAFLAEFDPLTQLPNRQHFSNRLTSAVKQAKRNQQYLAVMILDLDHFKDINDSYGHQTGDNLLLQVSERLNLCCRETDTLARLGGDEFVFLVEQLAQPEDAARVADKILQQLHAPFTPGQQTELNVAASVGICIYPLHADSAEALLQGADAALYRAKADGRNTYSFYSDSLTMQARARLVLEQRLRNAMKQNHLTCYYQPQLDISSGRIIGAEVLLRWLDPVDGVISPDTFIPLAEASGLIHPIGQFVLEQACRQGKAWQLEGLPNVNLAINVSAQQFNKGDLQQKIAAILQETGFDPACLELEVTENALMGDEEVVITTIMALRAKGIKLAIDDFGTGYSSLAYLKRLPVDVLKIDRRFIENLPQAEDDRSITEAIIDLAHNLRFKVLAEGVETAEQLAFLRQQRCDYYQGYYFSKAVPATAFAQLLKQQRDTPPVTTD
ncbi:putative bifunctional diguanylate cyclase/phosphodiesterase [Arsukibacterium sp.]|uniref:putative bifunctional diguanylate cyclase/phosphodiesterase n=1 Tax=Arsukibacterium sp. TaxID=1977258 RepID=UPI00299F23EE|nr:EAL domain-containing protein [Arsukibacterium sp.]MDX1678432.1 EAL domain-containing protein [Arsukibacterium sp.]